MIHKVLLCFQPLLICLLVCILSLPDLTAREGECPKAGDVKKFEIADKVFMEFCYIPPGETKLGSTEKERIAIIDVIKTFEKQAYSEPSWLWFESHRTPRTFKSKGYWLGKYEVTQGEWKAVLGKNPSFHSIVLKGGKVDRLPVDSVSWQDCQEFLKNLNTRPSFAKAFGNNSKCVLPREDEWEYAFRSGKGNNQPYYWGNELNGDQANCNGEYPFGSEKKGKYLKRTCEVDDTNGGKYAVHPWGLCHMSGNVVEWCENINSSPDKYNQCGGSWFHAPWECRAVSRFAEFQLPAPTFVTSLEQCLGCVSASVWNDLFFISILIAPPLIK